MFPCRPLRQALLLGVFALASMASAATVSFTGSFSQDDDIRYFSFDIAAPSTVTLLTYSYGGGTNAAGDVIPQGGFQPVLSLFSEAGIFLAASGANGQCPPQTVDSVTGLCVDAYLQQSNLAAGTYFVALTQFFNVPNTPDLDAGFLQQGTGNFTGESCGVPGGSFFDETCTQRTSDFALDIVDVDSAISLVDGPTPIPEPSSVLLISPALVWLAHRMRKRQA